MTEGTVVISLNDSIAEQRDKAEVDNDVGAAVSPRHEEEEQGCLERCASRCASILNPSLRGLLRRSPTPTLPVTTRSPTPPLPASNTLSSTPPLATSGGVGGGFWRSGGGVCGHGCESADAAVTVFCVAEHARQSRTRSHLLSHISVAHKNLGTVGKNNVSEGSNYLTEAAPPHFSTPAPCFSTSTATASVPPLRHPRRRSPPQRRNMPTRHEQQDEKTYVPTSGDGLFAKRSFVRSEICIEFVAPRVIGETEYREIKKRSRSVKMKPDGKASWTGAQEEKDAMAIDIEEEDGGKVLGTHVKDFLLPPSNGLAQWVLDDFLMDDFRRKDASAEFGEGHETKRLNSWFAMRHSEDPNVELLVEYRDRKGHDERIIYRRVLASSRGRLRNDCVFFVRVWLYLSFIT